MQDHVLLLVKAKGCPGCSSMEKIWPEYEKVIKNKFPALRIQLVQYMGTNGVFDYTKYPYGMNGMIKSYPSFFLVPGPLWDSAMSEVHKGKANPINLHIPTVKGCNYVLSKINNKLDFVMLEKSKQINIFYPESVLQWLDTNLKTEEKVKEKVKVEKPKSEEPEKTKPKSEVKFVTLKTLQKPCPSYKLKPKK
jgi:hypothetical protein